MCLETLNLSRDHVVFIGDTMETDIMGATAAGITSIWLQRKENNKSYPLGPPPNYIINNLSELKSLFFKT